MKEKKPLIGFFPLFYNLAETGRAVLVAKRYMEKGGKAIFFSHGGKYEKLAKNIGCKIIRVKPIYTEEFIEDLWKYSRFEKRGAPFSYNILKEHVEAEINAYRRTDVELVVTTNNFPCTISARVAGIPLISIAPKVIGRFTKYPDDAEMIFTRFLPGSLKLSILNFYYPKSKTWVRPFNKLAKQYNLPIFDSSMNINKGDFTFYTDFLELLQLKETDIKPNESFIGPIFLDELFEKESTNKTIEKQIENHIKKPGGSILLTLGSSGTKELFLQILSTLNKTSYNVIAVYSSILSKDEIPSYNDNILLMNSVPSIKKINEMVDLAIIHGGQGTVYTAAYAGKPVIGLPMQFEQHQNLEMLVKNKIAIIESRRFFKEEVFLESIKKIFDNYDYYLKNSQKLSKKLPKPQGDIIAVKKIIEILEKTLT